MSNQMPTNTFESMPPLPPVPPQHAVPKKTPFWKRPLLWVLAALLFGIAVGAGDPRTVEVTKEVPVEKIVEKEVEVAVPTTPEACTDALDYASVIFTMNAEAIGVMQNMLKHAVALDAAGMDADTAELDKLTQNLGKIKTPYQSAVEQCRASTS
jgi:hypothetical protein